MVKYHVVTIHSCKRSRKHPEQKIIHVISIFPLELFGLKIINCIFALGY